MDFEKLVEDLARESWALGEACVRGGDKQVERAKVREGIAKAVLVAYEKVLRDDYRRIKRDYDEIAQPYSSLCKEIDDVTDENEKLEKELTDLRAENERLKALFDEEAAITTNILRKWPREQIVRFAEHLIGDEISRLRAALDRQLIKVEALESDNERLERENAELRGKVEWKS